MGQDFSCNYNELARILNLYGDIVSNKPLLDSKYNKISKAAAEVVLARVQELEVKVPEEARRLSLTNTQVLKDKCLEIMSQEAISF